MLLVDSRQAARDHICTSRVSGIDSAAHAVTVPQTAQQCQLCCCAQVIFVVRTKDLLDNVWLDALISDFPEVQPARTWLQDAS